MAFLLARRGLPHRLALLLNGAPRIRAGRFTAASFYVHYNAVPERVHGETASTSPAPAGASRALGACRRARAVAGRGSWWIPTPCRRAGTHDAERSEERRVGK